MKNIYIYMLTMVFVVLSHDSPFTVFRLRFSCVRSAGLLLRMLAGVRTEAARQFGADWLRRENAGVGRARFTT